MGEKPTIQNNNGVPVLVDVMIDEAACLGTSGLSRGAAPEVVRAKVSDPKCVKTLTDSYNLWKTCATLERKPANPLDDSCFNFFNEAVGSQRGNPKAPVTCENLAADFVFSMDRADTELIAACNVILAEGLKIYWNLIRG